ncbi:MAG TPA: hypothetical protein VMI56_27585 [Reyranella sp.]|nr:hypothetical protein [Reyranella sp.]
MSDAVHVLADRGRVATRALAVLRLHGQRGKAGLAPDFDLLETLLSYVERTVRGVHYVQEEAHVAKPLEQARPDLRLTLGRLRRDHVGAGGYCFRMREALAHWKKGWSKAIDMYLDNARDHHRLSATHGLLMRKTVLPAAEAALSPEHWRGLERVLASAPDPLSGCRARLAFEAAVGRMMGRECAAPAALDADQGRRRPQSYPGRPTKETVL